jgi:hypothetical protein
LPRSISRRDSSDTAEAHSYTASSAGDVDPDVSGPNIAADSATGLCVALARVTVDAASRVAVAVVVAVDTAPGAVAGTVHPVDVPAIADRATTAGHYWTIDGPPAVDAAVLPRRFADFVAFARPSAVASAAEESGPAGPEFAVFGFSQPVAVVAVAQTGAAAALALVVFGFFQLGAVVDVAQTVAAAVELAAPVLAAVVVFVQFSAGSAAELLAVVAVCVPASLGAVGQFSAHSTGRSSRGVTQHQEQKRRPIA